MLAGVFDHRYLAFGPARAESARNNNSVRALQGFFDAYLAALDVCGLHPLLVHSAVEVRGAVDEGLLDADV